MFIKICRLLAFTFALCYNRTTTMAMVNENLTLTTTLTTTLPTTTLQETLPIVVLHGIASSAPNMDVFCDWLETTFQRKVYNIEIGNGKRNSVLLSMSAQLDMLCTSLYSIAELQYGFDFIGMSQGGLLARGYVEQCNKYPVRNLINLVSPNGGVAIPDIRINFYTQFYQAHFSISGYWRDPLDIPTYLFQCLFLPVLNNERPTELSEQYKTHMLSLANYIVVWSPKDDVVRPPESAKFSVYNEHYQVVPLENTTLYRADLLGLKTMTEQKRFHTYNTSCMHAEHRDPVCFGQLYDILKLYL